MEDGFYHHPGSRFSNADTRTCYHPWSSQLKPNRIPRSGQTRAKTGSFRRRRRERKKKKEEELEKLEEELEEEEEEKEEEELEEEELEEEKKEKKRERFLFEGFKEEEKLELEEKLEVLERVGLLPELPGWVKVIFTLKPGEGKEVKLEGELLEGEKGFVDVSGKAEDGKLVLKLELLEQGSVEMLELEAPLFVKRAADAVAHAEREKKRYRYRYKPPKAIMILQRAGKGLRLNGNVYGNE